MHTVVYWDDCTMVYYTLLHVVGGLCTTRNRTDNLR